MLKKHIALLAFSLVIGYAVCHRAVPVTNSAEIMTANRGSPVSRTIPAVSLIQVPLSSESAFESTNAATISSTNGVGLAVENRGAEEEEKYEMLHGWRDWAARDAEGALGAVLKLPEGPDRNQALEEICYGIAQDRPADAIELASSLHLSDHVGSVMDYLVQQWAAVDIKKCIEWVASQPVGELRDDLTTRVAYVLVQSSPADAANFVLNQMPPGQVQNDALLMIVHQWGDHDLAAATAWVEGFPKSSLRDDAIRELAEVRTRHEAMGQL